MSDIALSPATRLSADTQTASAVAALTDVRYRWPGRRGFKLQIDDFAVARQERVLLLGPSGSGKTTLLSLITGVIQPDQGRVEILGQDLGKMAGSARDRFRAEHFGIIFQMFNLLPYGEVADNILLPLSFAPGRAKRVATPGAARAGHLAEARRLTDALGLPDDILTSAVADLSVGQQQRVAVARALIGQPEIIIADEPTSALDADTRGRFVDVLFEQVAVADAALMMVSHDESFAPLFDRTVRVQDLLTVAEAP